VDRPSWHGSLVNLQPATCQNPNEFAKIKPDQTKSNFWNWNLGQWLVLPPASAIHAKQGQTKQNKPKQSKTRSKKFPLPASRANGQSQMGFQNSPKKVLQVKTALIYSPLRFSKTEER
jgi:hypothetical protein